MNIGVDYDFVNMYPGVQSNTATAAIGLTYNYETDIFKDYGFNTCTKFTAKNTTKRRTEKQENLKKSTNEQIA